MDFWQAIVMIVIVTSGFPVLKAWIERGGKGSKEADRKIHQQETVIADLQRRVEHLEALASDPTALAAMRVQQALNSGATVPTRVGQ